MSKSTRFWKSTSFLAVVALAGCQGGKNAAVPPLVSKAAVEVSPADENARADDLYLLGGASRITVGDNPGDVMVGGFKKPERGVTVTKLPPGLDDSFRFAGWETGDRSIGLISRNRTVLLALDTREGISQDFRDQSVTTYRKLFGLPQKEVVRAHCHYYFWVRDKVQLMVCTVVDPRGSVSMTSALGIMPLMQKFRMTAEDAERDASEAELRYNKSNGP